MNITLSQAETAIEAAKEKSDELEIKQNICVVDHGANLVAFVRMDGAWLGSIDISQKKAKTAVFFDMDTKVLSPMVQPGKSLYNIEHSNEGLISFPGGVLIKNSNNEIIGAIGASGSTVEDDHEVALAGAEAVS